MSRIKTCGALAGFFFLTGLPVQAGMTVYDLSDIVRLRLEDISFFLLLLALATLGIRTLWNFLARDFPRLPRLTFTKAFSLTLLLSVFMLLILIMIAGARELLTPGAWYRQGSHYRPNESGSLQTRQQSIERLRTALMQYAHAHQGEFPPHDYVPEIASTLWQAPDSTGSRYVYISGVSLTQSNSLLACEPPHFSEPRLALFASGKIQPLPTREIHRLLGAEDKR